jgi:hypothetical protein
MEKYICKRRFNLAKLLGEILKVNLCDDDNCRWCLYENMNGHHLTTSNLIIGISPTPDYLSYWKSSEGLTQIIEGLFRGDVKELKKTKVTLSFDFIPVKGFSVPMFAFKCKIIGDLGSIELIENELIEWSPRICGWFSYFGASNYVSSGYEFNYDTFRDYLSESQFENLLELTRLAPIDLNWSEFMNLSATGVFNRGR